MPRFAGGWEAKLGTHARLAGIEIQERDKGVTRRKATPVPNRRPQNADAFLAAKTKAVFALHTPFARAYPVDASTNCNTRAPSAVAKNQRPNSPRSVPPNSAADPRRPTPHRTFISHDFTPPLRYYSTLHYSTTPLLHSRLPIYRPPPPFRRHSFPRPLSPRRGHTFRRRRVRHRETGFCLHFVKNTMARRRCWVEFK